jgi:hypothetical protein
MRISAVIRIELSQRLTFTFVPQPLRGRNWLSNIGLFGVVEDPNLNFETSACSHFDCRVRLCPSANMSQDLSQNGVAGILDQDLNSLELSVVVSHVPLHKPCMVGFASWHQPQQRVVSHTVNYSPILSRTNSLPH